MPEPLHHALVACVSRGFITIYTGKYLCIPIITDAGTFRKLGAKCNVLGDQYLVYMPPEKLLGGGVLTPVPPFCLFCTIISNKTYILDLYQNTPQVLPDRSFLVAGFDTHVTPISSSCGLFPDGIFVSFKINWWTTVTHGNERPLGGL